MPLPRATEQAAIVVERALADLDRQLAEFVIDGGALPSIPRLLRPVSAAIRRAVAATLREIDEDVTDARIREDAAAAIAAVETQMRSAVAQARRTRRRARRGTPPPQEDNEPLTAYARRAGAIAALGIVARQGRRRRLDIEAARRAAHRLGAPLPRPTAAYARMVVRTEAALVRNRLAVEVARADDTLVIYIEDARNGPTDEPCERVNGKFATVEWFRGHLIEHPNCTRKGTPMPLPRGRRVTLLS